MKESNDKGGVIFSSISSSSVVSQEDDEEKKNENKSSHLRTSMTYLNLDVEGKLVSILLSFVDGIFVYLAASRPKISCSGCAYMIIF